MLVYKIDKTSEFILILLYLFFPLEGSKFCTVFSFIAIWFLAIIGSLLHTQPLYIKGPSDPEKASMACYKGGTLIVELKSSQIMFKFCCALPVSFLRVPS